jgi:ice-binding like protein
MSRNSVGLVTGVGVGLVMLLYAASPASAQTAPSLGAADTFAVLAGSTVTNTGLSIITGNLGLHPGTAVTGFPAGQVVAGTIQAANAAALAAKDSLTTAYNSLVSQACTQDLTGQDLGGKTLTTGVYCFSSTAQLTGTLTLNALGNSSAVFIFKMGSTLTTASASKVVMINGGSPSTVFWQVGSSATLGTTTSFVGNILALTSITVTTGVSVAGRTLARNGAVTLDTNAVRIPPPPTTTMTIANPCLSPEPNSGTMNGAARPADATNAPPSVKSRTAHIVEWDLPAPADASPGAMVVDTQGYDQNRLWFVTRLGDPRVYRFDPSKSLMRGNASWKSWALAVDSFTTGGLKKITASCDRRYVFVRTASSLQRVDTQNGERTEWPDQVIDPLNPVTSDLAIDDRNNIFTTGLVDPTNPSTGYVQMLKPGPFPGDGLRGTTTVTRWNVGGGAGICADLGNTTTSFPCLSGIAVHPSDRNIVFYSEPFGGDGFGNIAELNISTSNVRRWSLSALSALPQDPAESPVRQPRQLMLDRFGQVWVITGSGHLVSLDTRYNRMRKHAIPANALSDPFGLAPDDDVVGYTDAGRNMIGMLLPKGLSIVVSPTYPKLAPRIYLQKDVLGARANVDSGFVPPMGKVVQATITTKQDGVFVEAQLDSNLNDSMSPLGITANRGKGQGTFFYAVGINAQAPTADRVGFVRLPMPEQVRRPRDDDDDEDGWDHNSHPNGWHHGQADDAGSGRDDDRDGLDNGIDSPDRRERVDVPDDAPLGGGASMEYTVATSASSLALIATVTADDVLAQIGVEIYDAAGMLMATSAPAPGTAVATVTLPAVGTYRVRIRNYGATGIVYTPKLIIRENWEP